MTGFGAGEPITVTVDSIRIASVQADSAGAATSFPINMPGLLSTGQARDITLMAQGATSGTVKSATFHIVAP